jgi:formate hydrogenlyase subunit 6/NADH:ubiquinone oxidoreductase subunit I/menaquinone-dependent protoporphyrinogen IX oxidase
MSSNSSDQKIRNLLILYHSGSGSTKIISKVIKKKLMELDTYNIDLHHISVKKNPDNLMKYDVLIFGFPTYHCEPSRTIHEFIEKILVQENSRNVFVFTTYGLYTGNSLRIAIKALKKKNLICVDYKKFRGPASDGALFFPPFKFIFRYGRNVNERLNKFIDSIYKKSRINGNQANNGKLKYKIPFYKLYAPFNGFLKLFAVPAYNGYIRSMHVDHKECTICRICERNCPRDCWTYEDDKIHLNSSNCELCLKCIHNCPTNAILINEKMRDKPRLNNRFYKELYKGFFENKDN